MKKSLLATSIAASAIQVLVALPAQAAMEEQIITSERRATNLQETPSSVNAISADTLENTGITNIQELQNIAPSLVAAGNRGSGDGNLNLAIRGIGQRGSRPETGRGVGLYMDDIYYAITYGSNLQFTDLERVEVLRGPQGTLFGRNNTGGAVRYFTRKADPSGTYASLNVTAGDYGRFDTQGIFNVAFGDMSALRVVYAREERDGYMDWVDVDGNGTGRDALGAKENELLRAKLHFEPMDNLTIDLGASWTESWDNGLAQDAVGLTSPDSSYGQRLRDAILNETGEALQADDPRVVTGPFTNLDSCLIDGDGLLATRITPSNPDNPTNKCNTPRDIDTSHYNLDVTLDLSDRLSLRSITGYTEVESDGIFDWSMFGTYMREELADVDFWSQELQLNGISFEDRLTWVLGGSASGLEADEDKDVWVVNSAPAFTSRRDRLEGQNVDEDSWGVFAQGTLAITDRLNATYGVRYTEDQKDFSIYHTGRIDGYVVTNSAEWSDTNHRFVIDYNWSDDIMTYVSFSDGYKAGTFPTNINSAGCPLKALYGDPNKCDDDRELANNADIEPADPEKVENFEIGLRSQFMDRVRLNLTWFTMDYTDLQRRSRQDNPNDPDCTGGFQDGVCEADYVDGQIGAEIKGVEAEFLFAMTDNLTFTANGSKISTKITDNEGAADLQIGDPLETAPELNYTLGLNHMMMLDNGMTLDSNVNYTHRDGYIPPFASSSTQLTDSYHTVSARFALGAPDGRWEIAIGGTNLTDETFSYGLNYWGGFFGGLVQEGRGAPRMLYASGTYRFGDN